MAEMESRVGAAIAKIGFGKSMKQKWIKKDGDKFERIAADPVDADKTQLQKFISDPNPDSHEKKVLDNYKKRKHINVKTNKTYKVTKGPQFATERIVLETVLTTEMIRTGEWKNKQFKKYNFEADAPMDNGGHCHPLM